MPNLTDRAVAAFKCAAGEKQTDTHDDQVRGLILSRLCDGPASLDPEIHAPEHRQANEGYPWPLSGDVAGQGDARRRSARKLRSARAGIPSPRSRRPAQPCGCASSWTSLSHVANHVSTNRATVTTAVYARYSYEREKRAALQAWGARLVGVLEGSAEIVPLRALFL